MFKPWQKLFSFVLAIALALAIPLASSAAPGDTIRVSLATGGTEGNGQSYWPVISADGRYVAFDSAATSGWQIITIPGETKQGEYSSIALDQGGNPHISFMDETDVAVKYVRWDGSSWEAHTIDTLELYGYSSTSLALNGDGQPQIAYPYNNPTSLHHAEWDGVQWKWSKLLVGSPLYASLALKETGEPCISFLVTRLMGIEVHTNIELVCRSEGTWWTSTTVAVPSILYTSGLFTSFRFHSLALDSQNRAHISYTRRSFAAGNPHGLYYASNSTGAWVTTEVDIAPNVGFFSSLALDGQNRPHISYYDLANGDLKYARWNGSQWIIETVDSAGDVGRFTSLALDGNGNPHISYYDATNGDLKYTFWDGSQWRIETVDSSGRVGGRTSLALDAAGNVHISYYDITNGKLKYATNSGPIEHAIYLPLVLK